MIYRSGDTLLHSLRVFLIAHQNLIVFSVIRPIYMESYNFKFKMQDRILTNSSLFLQKRVIANFVPLLLN